MTQSRGRRSEFGIAAGWRTRLPSLAERAKWVLAPSWSFEEREIGASQDNVEPGLRNEWPGLSRLVAVPENRAETSPRHRRTFRVAEPDAQCRQRPLGGTGSCFRHILIRKLRLGGVTVFSPFSLDDASLGRWPNREATGPSRNCSRRRNYSRSSR